MSRIAETAAGVVMVIASVALVRAQEAIAPFARTERFVGTLTLQKPQREDVRVGLYQWIVRGRQKIAALELPVQGTTIVQLRAGKLTTVIDGQRQQRREGEFWTVPAGAALGIETDDDSAIIQTLTLSERR